MGYGISVTRPAYVALLNRGTRLYPMIVIIEEEASRRTAPRTSFLGRRKLSSKMICNVSDFGVRAAPEVPGPAATRPGSRLSALGSPAARAAVGWNQRASCWTTTTTFKRKQNGRKRQKRHRSFGFARRASMKSVPTHQAPRRCLKTPTTRASTRLFYSVPCQMTPRHVLHGRSVGSTALVSTTTVETTV